MNLTKVLLLICSFLIIFMYMNMAFYHRWNETKLFNANNSIFDQMQNLDIDYRNSYRYGATYSVDKEIQNNLAGKQNVVLLKPGNGYLKALKIRGIDMQEPSVFYYFTGINSVITSSPNVGQANYMLCAARGKFPVIVPIRSKGQLDTMIAFYNSYEK